MDASSTGTLFHNLPVGFFHRHSHCVLVYCVFWGTYMHLERGGWGVGWGYCRVSLMASAFVVHNTTRPSLEIDTV